MGLSQRLQWMTCALSNLIVAVNVTWASTAAPVLQLIVAWLPVTTTGRSTPSAPDKLIYWPFDTFTPVSGLPLPPSFVLETTINASSAWLVLNETASVQRVLKNQTS